MPAVRTYLAVVEHVRVADARVRGVPDTEARSIVHTLRGVERDVEHRARETRGLRSARELEAAIAEGTRRLMPDELRRLQLLVSAPHLAITQSFRDQMRSVVLGDERER